MSAARLTLIEDNPVLHGGLDSTLETLGYPVVACLDASPESITYVQNDSPDLVLVRVTLPISRSAVEIGKALRGAGFPIVFVVDPVALDLLERHEIRSPFEIFHWPNSADRLGAHIEMALERARLAKKALQSGQHNHEVERYRSMFEDAPISLWEEDFSAVKASLDELKSSGISDLRAYFAQNPEALERCRAEMRIQDANKASVTLYKARSKSELLNNLHLIFDKNHPGLMLEEILAISEGKTNFEGESVNNDLLGNPIDIQVNWSVAPGAANDYSNIFVSITDITARKRRETTLRVINHVTDALRVSNTRRELLPRILTQLRTHADIQTLGLIVYNHATNAIRVEAGVGEWAPATGRLLNSGESLTEKLLQDGSIFTSVDIKADKSFELRDLVVSDRCVAGLPLTAQKHAIGALWVARNTPFTPSQIDLLSAISDVIANSLHRINLLEQTQRYADQVATVGAIGRMLSTTLDLATIYDNLAGGILDLLPDIASIYISSYNPTREEIRFEYGMQDGERMEMSKFAPIPFESSGVGSQGEAIRTQQPLIVDNLQARRKEVRTAILSDSAASETQSGIYVPMLFSGSVQGVMYVQSYRANRFSQSDIELLTLIANTAAIAIQNARLFSATQRRIDRLTALHAIDTAISSSLDMRLMLNILLDQLVSLLHLEAADIFMLDATTQQLEYAAGRGLRNHAVGQVHLQLGEGLAGRAALENRIFTLSGTSEQITDDPRLAQLKLDNALFYSVAPLITKGQVKGVIEIFHRQLADEDIEWHEFLETLTGQVAVALDNSSLVAQLQRTNLELTLAYDRTLEGWSRALDLRDKITEDHTRRVTELTVRLAKTMGMSESEIVQMRRGAILHDIGKLGIPDRILQKTGPLNPDERAVMQRHPDYANEMLRNIEFLDPARVIPYCHHEKWDGTGYPRGLKGEEIPLAARMFAVIDVWDSLCSRRPYRDAWPVEKANEYLGIHSGSHFDPHVVDVFLKMIS